MFRDGLARLLVFRLGDERFGVPLDAVDEVVEAPSLQRLPDATPAQLGLASVRGELIVVYDAHRLLRVPGGTGGRGALLLFRRDGRRVGLAVDDVQDATTVEERDVYAMPGLDASDRTLLGLVRRQSELIAILDASVVLELTMAGAADAGRESA
jgi:purine-binding chemotaxis protein CheW